MIFRTLLTILLAFGHFEVRSESIELYSEKEFIGFIPYATFFSGWEQSNVDPTCLNFPQVSQQTLSSFKANGHCVLLFDEKDCAGSSIKLDKDVANIAQLWGDEETQDNFDDRTVSLKPCSGEEGGSKVQVDFYSGPGYSGTREMSYGDVCRCQDIPLDKLNVFSLDNHHNCVILYTKEGCQEGTDFPTRKIPAGKGTISGNFQFLGSTRVRSFRPCSAPQHCMKLSAEIFKFEVQELPNEDLQVGTMTIGAHTKFYNRGGATVYQEYSPKVRLNEETSVNKVSFSNRVTEWSVTPRTSLEFEFKAEAKGMKPIEFKKSLPLDLAEAYGESCEEGELVKEEVVTLKSSPEYEVKQIIEIPPCSEYEVNATLNIVENYEMHYKVYFKMGGESNGVKMSAKQVEEQVKTMTEYNFEGELDSERILVSANSSIKASFGVGSDVRGEGRPIPGCYP